MDKVVNKNLGIIQFFIILYCSSLLNISNLNAQINTESITDIAINTSKFPTKASRSKNNISLKKPTHIMIPDYAGGGTLRTVYNPNDTTTKTWFNDDKSFDVITTSNNNSKQLSSKKFDKQKNLISSEKLNPDRTKTKVLYNSDGTKSVSVINSLDDTLVSKTTVDATNKIINRMVLNPDKTTHTRTDIYSDGSQLITVANLRDNEIISKTFIRADGTKTNIDGKLAIAWHEAAHGVSFINNRSIDLIKEIGVQTDTTMTNLGNGISAPRGILGANVILPTYFIKKNNQEFENLIITSLAGGVADQVALSQEMLTNPQDIFQFFSHPSYDGDLPSARQAAQELVMLDSSNLSEIEIKKEVDDIIVNSYKKTYQFVIDHKHDIEKLATALVEQKIMSGDAVYNLLHVSKPLHGLEEGPLPLSLIEDYKLRGWANSNEQRIPFDDQHATRIIDWRQSTSYQKPDGTQVELQYLLNGNKAIEIQTAPDGTKTEIQYDSNGSQLVQVFHKSGMLIDSKIIAEPKQKSAPVENTIISIKNMTSQPSIAEQANAKEALNSAIIHTQQQSHKSRPDEQLTKPKSF